MLLKLTNLPTEGRLCCVESQGSGAHATSFSECQKVLEMAELGLIVHREIAHMYNSVERCPSLRASVEK
jgi:hypothetical protein